MKDVTQLLTDEALKEAYVQGWWSVNFSAGDSFEPRRIAGYRAISALTLRLVKEANQELINAYEDFIALLNEEIKSLSGQAYVHGWRSTRVEAGKKCREKIEHLREALK